MPDRLPRQWIGEPVHYRGHFYQVIEVLDAESSHPQLVLRGLEKSIQPDQWGDAHRRVPDTLTVALYAGDDRLNPELEWDRTA